MKRLIFVLVVGLIMASACQAEQMDMAKTIKVVNTELTTNSYEKTTTLPIGTKGFRVQAFAPVDMYIAYAPKNVTGSDGINILIKDDTVYEVKDLALKSNLPIYYNLSDSGVNAIEAQIEYWK